MTDNFSVCVNLIGCLMGCTMSANCSHFYCSRRSVVFLLVSFFARLHSCWRCYIFRCGFSISVSVSISISVPVLVVFHSMSVLVSAFFDRLPVCLSFCLNFSWFWSLFCFQFVPVSVRFWLDVCLSVCLSFCLSVCLSVRISYCLNLLLNFSWF